MKARTARREVQDEMDHASRLMAGLYPKSAPFEWRGLCVAHASDPATQISGDYYLFRQRPDGCLGICLVDAEGHGLVAANQVRMLADLLTRDSWGCESPTQALIEADRFVRRSHVLQQERAAFCMSYVVIDPSSPSFTYANAGMPFPILVRKDRDADLTHEEQAYGLLVGAGYAASRHVERTLDLHQGDCLLFATDGVVEGRDRHGGLFHDVLRRIAPSFTGMASNDVLHSILQALARHTGKGGADRALIVVGIGDARPYHTKSAVVPQEGIAATLDEKLHSWHTKVRPDLRRWLKERKVGPRLVNTIWTATWETLTNAVKHGSFDKYDKVRLTLATENGSIHVSVTQELPWVSRANDWSFARVCGTHVIDELADEVAFTKYGDGITLSFRREGGSLDV